jgi:sec-independent protein translocase protein TatA
MFSGLFQPMHLIVILIIVLVIWGPGKLPEIGEGLAKSIKSFKKTMNESATSTTIEYEEEKKDEEPVHK